jgi:hypothetical protein
MLKQHLKEIFSDLISSIKSQIVAGILLFFGFIFSYQKTTGIDLESLLQSQVPVWGCIVLSLLVLTIVSVPALIINHKNKSLKIELQLAHLSIKDLESKNNNSDPFIRAERKARIQKWRDDVTSCNGDMREFYETSSYIDLQPLLTKEESSRISHFNSQGNSIVIIQGAVGRAIVPANEMLKCYQQAINRIEKEWSLI